MLYLWIAIGSALGGVSRFALGMWIVSRYGTAFPWHTLTINILGSGLIGLFATAVKPTPLRLFLTVGICGGFTTFSSFSYETLTLLREGHSARALAYIALSVLICLASVWIGHAAGTALAGE
jgi:CrcB protein